MNSRDFLLECLRAALVAVDGRRAVLRELRARPLLGDWHIVAVGKAAGSMAQGAVDAMGTRLAGGIIIAPSGHLPPDFNPGAHRLRVCTASHPVPDASSLKAGERLEEFVHHTRSDAQLLCLVSGGASSLVESLLPGVGLDQLQSINRWAIQSGAPIETINAVRSTVSRLKGGGLARIAGSRRLHALMISDVPGNDPRVIGSGLLHAANEAPLSAYISLPPALQTILRHARAMDQRDAVATATVPVRVVASIGHACRAAAAAARAQGLKARIVRARLEGDAEELGAHIVASLAQQPAGIVQVRGGESTVTLPAQPGRGGRNQHLALAAALELERRQMQDGHVLAAGTDGVDGSSSDAGAIVDATSCQRGRDAGIDAGESLARADSGSLLEASGDLLHTGPTLTNVGDLVLALRFGWHR